MPGAVPQGRGLGDQSRTRGAAPRVGARCGTRVPAWQPQPQAAHLRTHSHSSSACASSRCLCASTFPAAQRGQGNQAGMRGLGGPAGGAPERTCRLGKRPASRLRARRASSAISRRGRCGGSAASLGAGGGRRGRAPTSDREPARLLRTPGVRLARGFRSPFGGALALVCEPLFRTGPANENKNQTGHTFQRDGSWL